MSLIQFLILRDTEGHNGRGTGGPSWHRRRRLREKVQARSLSRPVARQHGSSKDQIGGCVTVAGNAGDREEAVGAPPSLLTRLSDAPHSFSRPSSPEPPARLQSASNVLQHSSKMDVSGEQNRKAISTAQPTKDSPAMENDKTSLILGRSAALQIRSVLLRRLEEEQRQALLSRSLSSGRRL